MRISLLLVAIGFCVPAMAQAPENGDDRIVCKRSDDGFTGSNLRKWKKVCRKASEWKEQEVETQRKLRAANDKGLVDPSNLQSQGASPRP
jgi:hypothetical protein